MGFGPQLTAEVAQKALTYVALAIAKGPSSPAPAFDFTKPFKGALPKSSPIADAARSYQLKDGERWLVRTSEFAHSAPDDWKVPLKGITPWFDNLAWEYKLSVGKCGDCGRKACTPTCNAAPVAPEWAPLDVSDIQPGSTIEFYGPVGIVFMAILTWSPRGLRLGGRDNEVVPYGDLFLSGDYRINIGGERDANGQLVWKPCKKLKEFN